MIEQLREEAQRALYATLGPSAVIGSWSEPRQLAWSWQVALDVAGPDGGALLLKIPRWDEARDLETALAAGEQESTRREFDDLRRIELAVLASGDPGLSAVEPIAYVRSVNGILMRQMEARPMRQRLGRRWDRRRAGSLFDRLGRWIRVFHGIDGPPHRRSFDVDAARAQLNGWEQSLVDAGRSGRAIVEAIRDLDAWARRLDGEEEPWADVHGDLNLANVLVGRDDRVAVIDPNRVPGAALVDVARVMTDVRLDRGQLLTWGRLRPERFVSGWENRLCVGSGYDREPTLGFRLAEAALQRWVELELTVGGPVRLGLVVGRRRLCAVVRQLVDRSV